MKLAVILPTYNERENIITLLTALREVFKRIKTYNVVYLVVDDNSPDGTKNLVEQYQKKYDDVNILTGEKEGLGKALLRGMTYAVETLGAQILLQMDADLSHDPNVIPQFLDKIEKGADFVVGSRYIPGGSIPDNWGLHRKIFSVIGNGVVRFGLGYPRVHDWTGGYRMFQKTYYERIRDEIQGYSGYVFQIAFLHKAIKKGAKVAEVPIHFTDRRFGRSKIAPAQYIRNVFAYVLTQRAKRLFSHSFGKFLVVGTIGFIINTIVLEVAVHIGFDPTVGSVVGAELAIISNFILNNAWTFNERKIEKSRRFRKFLTFNGTSVGAILIQAGTIFIGTQIYGRESYRFFYIIGVGIGLVWNYTMYSHLIWKKK